MEEMDKKRSISAILSTVIILLLIFVVIPENKRKIKTQNFTFLFSSSIDSSRIFELSEVLENKYSKVSNNLNTKPTSNIEVNLYAERWRYIKPTGNWGASGSIEGVSKLHFINNSGSEVNFGKIAVHEFVHAVVLKLLIDREPLPLDIKNFDEKFSKLPVWIWEGVSVYEADQFYHPNTLEYLKNDEYPEISELNTRSKGQKIYTCGYTLIEYILKEYGRDKLIELIASYGDLESTFNISEEPLALNWHKFINEEYLNSREWPGRSCPGPIRGTGRRRP